MRPWMPLLASTLLLACGHAQTPSTHASARVATHARSTDAPTVTAGVVAPSVDGSGTHGPSETLRWELRRDESFHRAAQPTVAAACGAEVAAALAQLRVDEVSDCAVSVYRNGARRLVVVTVSHGPVQDCESGCFQDSASAVLRDGRVVAVSTSLVALPSPYGFVTSYLREELTRRSLPIQHPNGTYYDFFMPEGWCANYHDRVVLMSRDAELYWALEIPPTSCTARLAGVGGQPAGYDVALEGEITISVGTRGVYPAPVFTGMRLTVTPTAASRSGP